VTFKELQKLVQSQSEPKQSQLLQRLRDKPFWIWDRDRHMQADTASIGDCWFNYIIGSAKDGVRKPLYDYERTLYHAVLEPEYFSGYPSSQSNEPRNIALSICGLRKQLVLALPSLCCA
jgi:hypothetical protein